MTADRVLYSDGFRWQLREPAVFETGIKGFTCVTEYVVLTCHGRLHLKSGYATDGITGITGKPWACLFERKWLRRGSFGHDGLYQLIRIGLLPRELRDKADQLLRQWCIEDGAWKWQADAVYKIVAETAADAVLPSSERPVLVAP